MKYDLSQLEHRDSHALLTKIVLPRPIAFVSTISSEGILNLAPFSYFTVMSSKPAILGFGIATKKNGEKKDTLVNIESTKDFVINVVTEELAQAMILASGEYAPAVNEFEVAGLTALPSDLIRSPRVGESPVNMECRLVKILEFGAAPRVNRFIVGEVLRVHANDEYVSGKTGKESRFKVIGRMGDDLHCRTGDVFQMKRPTA